MTELRLSRSENLEAPSSEINDFFTKGSKRLVRLFVQLDGAARIIVTNAMQDLAEDAAKREGNG